MNDLINSKIPLTIVATLMLNAAAAVWWVSAKDRDTYFLGQRVTALELVVNNTASTQSAVLERLARIEERLSHEAAVLDRIEQRLNVRARH